MKQKNKVMVAVDFSEESCNALRFASKTAERENADMVILDVLTEHLRDPAYAMPYTFRPPILDFWKRQMEERLSVMVARCVPKTVSRSIIVQAGDSVAKEIVNVADESRCSLIIIARKHMSRMSYLLRGNLIFAVVRDAPCPVIVLHPSAGKEHTESEWGREHKAA